MEDSLAAQAKFQSERGFGKVHLVRNNNFKRDGTKAYARALNKHRFQTTKPGPYFFAERIGHKGEAGQQAPLAGQVHSAMVLHVKTDDHGGRRPVDVEDVQHDSQYLGEVKIGEPPQTVMLDWDTGSSDLWVALSKDGKKVFDTEKSKTWEERPGQTWSISYGDGSTAAGRAGVDKIAIGDMVIENQTVELAEQMSQAFISGPSQGLVGLGFKYGNTVKTHGKPTPVMTPLENLVAQDDSEHTGFFSVALYSDRDHEKSFYGFNYIDHELIKASGEPVKWVPITPKPGWWLYPSQRAVVNGKTIELPRSNAAILDTGTTLGLLSDQLCEAIYAQIEGARYDEQQQGFIFPKAHSPRDLPTIELALGDHLVLIQPEDLIYADAGEDMVYGSIQSSGKLGVDIFGDAVLKSIYAIFDTRHQRIGFVRKWEKHQHLNAPDMSP